MVTVVGCLLVFVQVAAAPPQNGECDLPRNLQPEIASKYYPGLRLVTLSDLQELTNWIQSRQPKLCLPHPTQ